MHMSPYVRVFGETAHVSVQQAVHAVSIQRKNNFLIRYSELGKSLFECTTASISMFSPVN